MMLFQREYRANRDEHFMLTAYSLYPIGAQMFNEFLMGKHQF